MIKNFEEIAECIRVGKLEEASTKLKIQPSSDEDKVEKLFLEGRLRQRQCDWEGAIDKYQAALQIDPDHSETLFQLAYVFDLQGDDEEAMDLYERCIQDPPSHLNALLNLAVLYEDHGRYEDALELVKGVVEQFPNHVRARMFLEDIQSSLTMHYDEEREATQEKRDAILDMPISEFELSVRSRNCLKQMDIHTLGDLLKVSEQQLLGYKNFGETSLNEIKTMLTHHKLRLGQSSEDQATRAQPEETEAAGEPNVINRSVAELALSVRSRKCLQRLGVTTIRELTQKSEAELLSTKNFGQTSLVEIKRRLHELGLDLRDAK